MRLLFLGDVFGRPGRDAVDQLAPAIIRDEKIDITVINVENIAGGSGVTHEYAKAMLRHAQLLTSGNHIWAKKEIYEYLNAPDTKLLRPMNYPPGAPGKGWAIVEHNGFRLGVVNVEGRVFMKNLDDPFRAVDEALAAFEQAGVKCALVDMHCDATSEKWAMGHHVDGRASACVGTHTHVQTADERILKKGTAFLTDAGMCGPFDSIIGMKTEPSLERMLTQRNAHMSPAEGDVWLQGAIVDIDETTGRATAIKRVRQHLDGT